jgi:NAD(P)H-hydrate epimerase
MVLDAEALHAIAASTDAISGKNALLTPNVGEYQILSGSTWPETVDGRRTAVQGLAKQYNATVIVKGAVDFVSDGDRVHLDNTGSPYLTKGGYGDLLAGVAGAHLARGRSPFDAAKVAAFIVGKAGELAGAWFGESVLASDVLSHIDLVVRSR